MPIPLFGSIGVGGLDLHIPSYSTLLQQPDDDFSYLIRGTKEKAFHEKLTVEVGSCFVFGGSVGVLRGGLEGMRRGYITSGARRRFHIKRIVARGFGRYGLRYGNIAATTVGNAYAFAQAGAFGLVAYGVVQGILYLDERDQQQRLLQQQQQHENAKLHTTSALQLGQQ